MIIYPASTGRNFEELLRVIDSLQLTAHHKVATPANWKQGEDVVISPSISNEDAKGMFPKGFKEVKPYLRMTPQPDQKETDHRNSPKEEPATNIFPKGFRE
jgi:peroxiredoxin